MAGRIARHLVGIPLALALAAGLVWTLTGPLAESLISPAPEPEPEAAPEPKEAPDLRAKDFAEHWGATVSKRGAVELPRGVPMPEYAFEIASWLKSNGCSADTLREVSGDLDLKYSCPPNPQRKIRFVRGAKFREGAVRLALLFRTDGMSIPALGELDALENSFALVVDPKKGDASLEQDLKRLKNFRPEDVVLSLKLKKSGKFTMLDTSGAVYPQLPPEEVRRRVGDLFLRFPKASGVVPDGSGVPLNYEEVTEALTGELAARRSVLLLPPQYRSPKLRASCARRPGLCLEIGLAADTARAVETLWKGVSDAKRLGSKILALPLTLPALRGVRELERNALDSGWAIEPMERFRPAETPTGGRR